jgi:hypothetical protein
MFGRTTVFIALALALALPAAAPARQVASPKAPIGLKAFLLRYEEPTQRNFSRTPSFGWNPTPQALSYDFELATSSDFGENSIVWSSSALKTADVSVPMALPWTTGRPYSLFARVRARTQHGMTRWSANFGFNIRWADVPAQLSAPRGLLRWTPVDGASGYEVWEMGITGRGANRIWYKTYSVATNVTDMRDWYTFHQDSSWTGTVHWRVRAVRSTYGTSLNGFDAKTYGPWSPVFTTTRTTPEPTAGLIGLGGTVSDTWGTVAKPKAHALMPGFYWNGNQSQSGTRTELYRTHVYSDRDCVHEVFTGAAVGSPAWAPRASGPLALPTATLDINKAATSVLADGTESSTITPYGATVTATEGGTAGDNLDLWDRLWPSGVYYWTVVPVHLNPLFTDKPTTLAASATAGQTSISTVDTLEVGNWVYLPGESTRFVVTKVTQNTTAKPPTSIASLDRALSFSHPAGTTVMISTEVQYVDSEVPQDTCAAGRIGVFGKVSQPVGGTGTAPYVTGLTKAGVLRTAKSTNLPTVYGSPLVAWAPALGADEYEVQWSRVSYPFPEPTGATSKSTYATSAILPLKPGKWYYRIRGINFHSIVKTPASAQAMAWSKVQKLVVTKPVFKITH